MVKLNAAGTAIVYGSYLGGSGSNGESVGGIALDPSGAGRVVVAGDTDSNNLPTKNAYDTTLGGIYDGFIAAYDTTLTGTASLLYSSYFGGSNGGGGTGNESLNATRRRRRGQYLPDRTQLRDQRIPANGQRL